MPQAVTHILFPILAVALFRDFYLKKNEKAHFPLHYILIAGLGGVLPDIDIVFSIILNLFGAENWWIHKTFFHSLFFPLILFAVFIVLGPIHCAYPNSKIWKIGRHKMKLSVIFLMLSLGVLFHIGLDALAGEEAYLFYPFSEKDYGINLVSYLSLGLQDIAMPTLDGILLVLWLIYLEARHRISDFI